MRFGKREGEIALFSAVTFVLWALVSQSGPGGGGGMTGQFVGTLSYGLFFAWFLPAIGLMIFAMVYIMRKE